ncbi:MBL fold metallo-hydrolase [Persephonella sp.]
MAKPRIKHYLINEKTDDPGIVIEIESLGEYILFDIGNIRKLNRNLIKKINKIFISHTHMDHFIGFDHLLRNKLGKAHEVQIFGIDPLAHNIYCKLQGYTWNLVEFEPQIIFTVKQWNNGLFETYQFDIKKKFAKDFIKEEKSDTDIVYEDKNYRVRFAVLDHKIPVMGYSFEYKEKLYLKKEKITELPLKGKEIGEFKRFLENEKNSGKTFKIGDKEYSYEYLKEEYSYTLPGYKISYITDVVYSEENKKKIVELVKNSDVLYCEAVFLSEDKEQASKVYHLTADQTGEIAKEANVKKLIVFHFSRRYGKNTEKILQEVKEIFPETY